MKNLLLSCLISILCLFNISIYAQGRQVRDMDFNWKFILGDHPGAENPSFNDKDWRTLNVPHDWSIESAFSEDIPFGQSIGYLPTGTGWYRKSFTLSKKEMNQSVWIEFDGVYMNSDVWINGKHLGHYPYGYGSFRYMLNPHIKEGINAIAVKVDNSKQPGSRWYSGSGIYRHVRLVIANPLHVGKYGIYLTTPEIQKEYAIVDIKTSVENFNSTKQEGTVLSIIMGKNGKEVARLETPFSVENDASRETVQKIKIPDPELWSTDSPSLYRLQTIITEKGKTIDNVLTNLGVRKTEFDAVKGFLLNGVQVKMKGVNLHHDGGPVGAAVPEGVWIRRLNILKEMGCNAIRTSHNPVAPEFLDICDSLGFLVMDEAFDEWKESKREYGYHKYFDEWSSSDLTQMIRRDRNHPSIMIWSVGNEVPDQTKPNGHETLKKLKDICRTEDPTRPVTAGCDLIAYEFGPPTTLKFMEGLDIVGYNYVDRMIPRRELLFTIDKLAHPDWKMIGTENSSIYSVRGEYSIGNKPDVFIPNYHTAMIDIEHLWKYILTHDFVIGDFMWTGIDYLGEAKWPSIGPPCGVIDRCGFPKDSYYFYKSIWTKEPMIHLFPHWNWSGREGQVLPVVCYTNCEEVELFLNGKSYGVQIVEFPRKGKTMVTNWSTYDTRKHATTSDLHLTWYLPYEPGVVKAVGKTGGKIVYTEEIRTAGVPATLRLTKDKQQIESDNRDVAHVKVEIVDKDGNVVPAADNKVFFTVEGPAKIIGVDNGNPYDHNSMKINERNAFHGLCLSIIQTTGKAGNIKITAKADNLGSSMVEIIAK
jgi:beta-galactosidase